MYKYKIVMLIAGKRPLISYGITADNAEQALKIYKSCLIRDGLQEDMLDQSDWMVFYGGLADA